ncbi:hypothetical protein EV356DRAFT_517277 [Viridothelium virens]|uniref:Cell wall mannoprotein 1 n=1 Tax=Viridothelium virens TaxID=1048519 RepID=A0A6A6H3R5_VIRVR|nr:hypothetical protein EV356DRAFT_517277 [Viridothelium virens]
MHAKYALLALIGTAFGRVVVKRDVQTILTALSNVNSATETLDTEVKAFDGSAGAISTLNADSAAVLSSINTGTTNVQATTPISDNDALQVASATETLINTLNTTIDDLIAKKPTFVSSGQSATVLSQLQQQRTASNSFSSAIVSKTPSDLSSIAQSLTAQIAAEFQTGINAFS